MKLFKDILRALKTNKDKNTKRRQTTPRAHNTISLMTF